MRRPSVGDMGITELAEHAHDSHGCPSRSYSRRSSFKGMLDVDGEAARRKASGDDPLMKAISQARASSRLRDDAR